MTASLSNLGLSLEQTSEQRRLRVVTLSYSYQLTNKPAQNLPDSAQPFLVEIDIIGDDVLSDDILARRVDAHEVSCEPNHSTTMNRQFTLAQGILDEDVGDDEIKVRIRVNRDTEPTIEAMTPIVKGKF